MIKYTILYKNGKTWNGKAAKIEDIPIVNCTALFFKQGNVIKVYTPIAGYGIRRWSYIFPLEVNQPRKPNPASVTKKQKAFDKAYAKWLELQADLNQGRRGGADTSIKAYKKWLLLDEWGKPVKYSEPKKTPIKVTYTFWLGAFGEISDER